MKLGLFCIVILIIVSNIAVATPPAEPCDERIDNKTFYENEILSNGIIDRLNDELDFRTITVSNCFVSERLKASINYNLPANFSSYGIVYMDHLDISYLKNGTLEMGEHGYITGVYEKLDHDIAIERFKERIKEVESNDRIKEFILKLNPVTASMVEHNPRISAIHGWIEYSWDTKLVRGYLVPNNVEWVNFPEIEISHEIVKNNVIPKDLPNCSIAVDSYTSMDFYDFEDGPMYMTVALTCTDGRKDAKITLNADGSYKVSRVESYTITSPGGLPLSTRAWIDSALTLVILIAIPSIIIWLAVRRKKIGKRMNS